MAPLTYSLEGKVALLAMDDGKANALSPSMIEALLEALTRAEAEASAVVLIGRAERFSAGFDLRVMMSSPDTAKALLTQGADLLMRLFGSPLPIVAACTGHALAGGALMLLSCDVRVGATGPYKLGLNEVAIGMPVPVLAMELARARLTPTELSRATLGAHIYDPEGAVKAGYLDTAIAGEEVLAAAKAEAARLSELSRNAYAKTKERLRRKVIDHIQSTFHDDMKDLLGG